MPKKPYRTQRIKIGKSFFVPVLLKVISTNPDGSPRWLEIARDEETMDLQHGSREFYMVWGSELLAGRAKQDGKKAIATAEPTAPAGEPTVIHRLEGEPATVPVDAGENEIGRFAVWLDGRGWLVAAERDEEGYIRVADRLHGATQFETEDEARAELEAVARLDGSGYAHLSECGSVVTL